MKSLVISIHDFSPNYLGELEEILKELDIKGFNKRTILAIPNNKNSFSLKDDKNAVELLYKEFKRGNEICLHGYNHYREGKNREFKNIKYEEAICKVRKGKSELERLGICAKGFVPPYWKINCEGEKAVKDEGFIFLTKNSEIKDLRSDKIYISKPIWFWPSNRLLDYTFRYFDDFLAKFLYKSKELVRVVIHPKDIRESKPFDYGLRLIQYLSKERILISYEQFFDSMRK